MPNPLTPNSKEHDLQEKQINKTNTLRKLNEQQRKQLKNDAAPPARKQHYKKKTITCTTQSNIEKAKSSEKQANNI